MRPRRTLTTLRIGDNLVKSGHLWMLDIASTDTKTRRALDYPLSVSARIDVYLAKFRDKIPGSAAHAGLWSSNLGCPMRGDSIYEAVGGAHSRRLASQSICTASATPPRASGQVAIRRTCEEQRIYSVNRHSERRKGTTSWRTRASRVIPSLGPLEGPRYPPVLSRMLPESRCPGQT